MVKGNWERRAELSVLRRKEEKDRKAAKRLGYKSAAAVAASLLARDTSSELTGIESLKCFCFSEEEEGVIVCSEYLRTGGCRHAGKKGDKKKDKKERSCKYGHDTECIQDVFDKASIELPTEETEPRIVGPFDLRLISSKRHRHIAFIGVNGECVFDHLNPFVWVGSKYNNKARAGSVTSEVSEPGDVDNDEGGIDRDFAMDSTAEGGGACVEKCPAGTPSPLLSQGDELECATLAQDQESITKARDLLFKVTRKCYASIGSYLEDEEVAHTKEICKSFKDSVLQSLVLRTRIKEARSARAGALSKKKKAERKKSIKAANIGSKAKIDGFARGGATGS